MPTTDPESVRDLRVRQTEFVGFLGGFVDVLGGVVALRGEGDEGGADEPAGPSRVGERGQRTGRHESSRIASVPYGQNLTFMSRPAAYRNASSSDSNTAIPDQSE